MSHRVRAGASYFEQALGSRLSSLIGTKPDLGVVKAEVLSVLKSHGISVEAEAIEVEFTGGDSISVHFTAKNVGYLGDNEDAKFADRIEEILKENSWGTS